MKTKKIPLTHFIKGDRFELNQYLAYLFKRCNIGHQNQLKGNKNNDY